MKKRLFKGLALTLALCTTFVVGLEASTLLEPISAYLNHGISVEYNDVDQVMLDANGAKVVPITYNGSTYLPVRAVANMLGVQVGWDELTQTVLLGNSYPDTVSPSPEQTPQLPASTAKVPTIINSTQVDISFIFDIFNKLAPNKYKVDDYYIENGNIVGTVLQGKLYEASSTDVSYSFSGVMFESADGVGHVELDAVENEIVNELTANGYKYVQTDAFGQKHYVNGKTEIRLWDVLEDNTSLRIEIDTGWLSCHANNG